MLIVKGLLADGKSSKLIQASLESSVDGSIILRTKDEFHSIPIPSIDLSTRIGNSARYLSIQDHGRFETNDNDTVDLLAAELGLGQQSNFLHRLESNISLIAIAAVFTVVFMWMLAFFGVPKTADLIVDSLPKKTSHYIENKLIDHLETEVFQPSELSNIRRQEVLTIYQKVVEKLNVEPSFTKIKIRKASEEIGANALAFPSGTIVITDQLIQTVESDKQLSGIIAHEIGHVLEQHSLRQMVRGSIFALSIAFIVGDISGASATVLSAPALLLELQYSREFETDADGYALKYFECDAEGLRQMANFFVSTESIEYAPGQEKTPNNSTINLSQFLTTHPLSTHRKSFFENHIDRNCS